MFPDEATSALDTESELVVQNALDNLLQASKRTTIIVAHRLSTIRNADVIVYVGKGRVLEQGSHNKLMKSSVGLYRNLVEKNERNEQSNEKLRESSYSNLTHLNISNCEENNVLVQFNDVNFAYPTRSDRLIYKNFNLSILKGETLALVGPSGGGKSTCVSSIKVIVLYSSILIFI